MLKKDKTKPFRVTAPDGPTSPTAEDMLKNCAINKLKADRTPIPDNRFTLPPEYGVAGGAPKIIDGYEYVDLGLPSGILWAKMNVGAESETDYGLYFAWGETQGYADASTKAFGWGDYKYGTGVSDLTKYNSTDGETVLYREDDAANVNMGGDWIMPTKEQCDELFNTTYVTNSWVTDYQGSGINGCLFTSVSNGNTMFIPAAGMYMDGGNDNIDYQGFVWTSTLSQDTEFACFFGVSGEGRGTGVFTGGDRWTGQSVRGVHNSTPIDPLEK